MTGTTIASSAPSNHYLDCLSLYDFEEDPLSCMLCITSDTASSFLDWVYNSSGSNDNKNRNSRNINSCPTESNDNANAKNANRRQIAAQEMEPICTSTSHSVDYVKLHMALIESLFQEQKQQTISRSSTMKRKNRKRVTDDVTDRLSLPTAGNPSSYLSKECCLQKDKGRGNHPGSDICAKGREATLLKVGAKIELLVKANNATVNKGWAKLTNVQPVETRSVLSVKMGFLSMNYGVLLQWREGKGGEPLVDLVVLRKMAPSSFMNVHYNRTEKLDVDRLAMIFCQGWCNVNTTADDISFSQSFSEVDNIQTTNEKCDNFAEHRIDAPNQSSNEAANQRNKSTSLILRDIVDDRNTAILESTNSGGIDDDGNPSTEVTSLQPPYNVPKPALTSSCQLFVDIHCIRDLQLHPSLCHKKNIKRVSVYTRLSLGNTCYVTKKAKLSSLISMGAEEAQSNSSGGRKSYLDNYFKFTTGTNQDFKIEVFCVRGRLRRTQVLAELILPVTTIQQYFIHSHTDPTLVPLQLKLPLSWSGVPGTEGGKQQNEHQAFITFSVMYDNALYRWIKQELRMVLLRQQHRLFLPLKQR